MLLGATGYTGRLVAAALAAELSRRGRLSDVRVGLAGRSLGRLQELRATVAAEHQAAAGWPLLRVDTTDTPALQDLAARTSVLVSTVGPYSEHGLPVVAACAQAGTHYADITGEVLFIRDSIDRYDAVARGSGARIVHSCGFDSIPSDLGMLLLHRAAVEAEGPAAELAWATFVLTESVGGVSGGTLASMAAMGRAAKEDPRARAVLADPYALSPERGLEADLGDQRELGKVERDEELGLWVGPFVMASINTRVVRRSNALLGHSYGSRLRYREVSGLGSGDLPKLAGNVFSSGSGPAPKPGEGPTEEERVGGRFSVDLHGRTEGGTRVLVHITAAGDPGYAATSRMLTVAALALLTEDGLGGPLPRTQGVLTPATAFGVALIAPLAEADVRFGVGSPAC